MRAHSGGDHLLREFIGWNLPAGKERLDAGWGELRLSVGANVFQEEVAERDGVDALCEGTSAGCGHRLFVMLVGAWPGQRNLPQRKTRSVCLLAKELLAKAVHRDAFEMLIDGGEQADELDRGILLQQV
jgi:hypothetical protein